VLHDCAEKVRAPNVDRLGQRVTIVDGWYMSVTIPTTARRAGPPEGVGRAVPWACPHGSARGFGAGRDGDRGRHLPEVAAARNTSR
jgi:hypothetical protein